MHSKDYSEFLKKCKFKLLILFSDDACGTVISTKMSQIASKISLQECKMRN